MTAVTRLNPFDAEKNEWQVLIETPKGCHNKYKYDDERNVYVLSNVLPEGMVFPYDFGFLPSTLGDDGDPLDVLLLMDEPAFCGCVVPARLVGVIEAQQAERDGRSERNDRLMAVPCKAHNYGDLRSIKELDPHMLNEIEQFFVSYNRIRGKRFKVLALHGPEKAEELAREGIKRYTSRHRKRRAGGNRKSRPKSSKT